MRWASVVVLLATGYWMLFAVLGGWAGSGMHVHIMHALGVLMMALFLHVFFGPYRRLRQAVAGEDWPQGAKQLARIRFVVGANLILGLLVLLVAGGGRVG